jgi:hypothetical protein
MLELMRRQLRTGLPSRLLWPAYQRLQLWRWLGGAKTPPPPHIVKQRILVDYAQRFQLATLIETGTYLGDMVWAVRNQFEEIHSIELDDRLCTLARDRFARFAHIRIHHGDSVKVLPGIVRELTSPALFWLDGHFSGPDTARGETDSPVTQELTILLGSVRNDVILIDDARLFTGDGGYPTMQSLQKTVRAARSGLAIEVEDDVIRIVPPGNDRSLPDFRP